VPYFLVSLLYAIAPQLAAEPDCRHSRWQSLVRILHDKSLSKLTPEQPLPRQSVKQSACAGLAQSQTQITNLPGQVEQFTAYPPDDRVAAYINPAA
jgi:hypothetical protein